MINSIKKLHLIKFNKPAYENILSKLRIKSNFLNYKGIFKKKDPNLKPTANTTLHG